MTKLGGLEGFVYWDNKEIAEHNTERHRLFKAELYPYLTEGHKAFTLRVIQFKKNHPELFEE